MLLTNKKAISYRQFHLTHTSSLEPFVLTDILSEYAGDYKTNCFHFWSMTNQVILGMKDTRVSKLKKGLTTILDNGYYPVVRNSGGLSVVADEGILNFSIILSQPDEKKSFSVDQGYQLMTRLIKKALNDFACQIEAYEVSDSYCPGLFDLSIDGKKFAGISQRRIKKGIAIMIYLSVSGNQQKRGQLIRQFYQASLGTNFGENGYPAVNPGSMATLSELLKTKMTVNQLYKRLDTILKKEFSFDSSYQNEFDQFLASDQTINQIERKRSQMKQRNELINWSEQA